MARTGQLRIAIVHDYLREYGGAEKVAQTIQDLFPSAPFFTTYYMQDKMPDAFRKLNIRVSPIQNLPGLDRFYLSRLYVYLYPFALRTFDFDRFDYIVSSTAGIAKWIDVPQTTVHFCYCHSVPRFLYYSDSNVARSSNLIRFANSSTNILNFWLRQVDQISAKRVDYFIANSTFTASKIAQVYRRQAKVIYPPVEVNRIKSESAKVSGDIPNDYFLALGARTHFKQLDQIVEACNAIGAKLKIVGLPGTADKVLAHNKSDNVQIYDFLETDQLMPLLANCRAVILGGKEDFGIVAVEALAAGRPIIAQRYSGTAEIIQQDQSYGMLFDPIRGPTLKEVLERFQPENFDPERCQQRALQFDRSVFEYEFPRLVAEKALESSQQRERTIKLFASLKEKQPRFQA